LKPDLFIWMSFEILGVRLESDRRHSAGFARPAQGSARSDWRGRRRPRSGAGGASALGENRAERARVDGDGPSRAGKPRAVSSEGRGRGCACAWKERR